MLDGDKDNRVPGNRLHTPEYADKYFNRSLQQQDVRPERPVSRSSKPSSEQHASSATAITAITPLPEPRGACRPSPVNTIIIPSISASSSSSSTPSPSTTESETQTVDSLTDSNTNTGAFTSPDSIPRDSEPQDIANTATHICACKIEELFMAASQFDMEACVPALVSHLMPQLADACDSSVDIEGVKQRFATDVAAAVFRALRRDPFSRMSEDLVLHTLLFFSVWDIARLRAVSRSWRYHASKALRLVTCAELSEDSMPREQWHMVEHESASAKALDLTPSAVQLLVKHCPRIETLTMSLGCVDDVSGEPGYDAAYLDKTEVETLLSSHHIKALCVDARSSAYRTQPRTLTIEPLLPSLRTYCRSLRVLCVGTSRGVSDTEVQELATSLPNLQALQLVPCDDIEFTDPGPVVSSVGLAALINLSPSLRLLQLYHTTSLPDVLPPLQPGLRHLSLPFGQLSDTALGSLLDSLGSDLLSLNVCRNPDISDSSVFRIANQCPKLQLLSLMGTAVTPACLSAIVRMRNTLEHVWLDEDGGFSREQLDVIEQQSVCCHSSSSEARNSTRTSSGQNSEGGGAEAKTAKTGAEETEKHHGLRIWLNAGGSPIRQYCFPGIVKMEGIRIDHAHCPDLL